MNLPFVALGKFTVLIFILIVAFLPRFGVIGFSNSVYIECIIGLLYFITGWLEVIKKKNRVKEDYFRVNYLPFMIISKRIIRVFLFLVMAALMISPEVEVYMLVPVLLIMAVGDVIFFIESIFKNCFSILFYDDYLFFMLDRELKVFPKEIRYVEYRYENFYLVLFNRDTIKINPEWMKEVERDNFHLNFLSWAGKNKILFTDEAKITLKMHS